MEEKRTKKELVAVCLLVLSLILITIGTTFAFFQYSKQGQIENKLESGTLTFIYDENRKDKNGVSLTNAFPISDEEGTWKKANANTANWYNYCNQEWANAVTIGLDEDGGTKQRETYQKAVPDTPIEMDDINTMWVWIPRYEYNYTNMETIGQNINKPGEIEINFINGTSSKVSDENNYKMHPAFTFGSDELTGFWYGKFETSNEEQIFNDGPANNSNLTPVIKPGVVSWRWINISNAFYASLSMNSTKASTYGFKGEKIDTHMSKDSEWGSVAYLSQSKYGKYGNDTYGENDKEVYNNNCSNCITGIAGDAANARKGTNTCNKNTYDTLQGQKASTTGNITGVYDMSGNAWERVMGVLEDSSNSGKPIIVASSGFVSGEAQGNKIPEAKYYDSYSGNDVAKACNGIICYGHALSETSTWYGDYHIYVSSARPWSTRGDYYDDSTHAGVFSFNSSTGAPAIGGAFRLVLALIGS